MLLYLVRHGEAEPEKQMQTRPPFHEPGCLSEIGRKQAEKTALHLRKRQVQVDKIWHSEKLRAKQTADIIAHELKLKEVYKKSGLKPLDEVQKIAGKIFGLEQNIMIVSHLPFLSRLASLLIDGLENDTSYDFKPAEVKCLVEVNGKWSLSGGPG